MEVQNAETEKAWAQVYDPKYSVRSSSIRIADIRYAKRQDIENIVDRIYRIIFLQRF